MVLIFFYYTILTNFCRSSWTTLLSPFLYFCNHLLQTNCIFNEVLFFRNDLLLCCNWNKFPLNKLTLNSKQHFEKQYVSRFYHFHFIKSAQNIISNKPMSQLNTIVHHAFLPPISICGVKWDVYKCSVGDERGCRPGVRHSPSEIVESCSGEGEGGTSHSPFDSRTPLCTKYFQLYSFAWQT